MAQSFLWVMHIVVIDSGVSSNSVVPECNRPFLPPHSSLEVLPLRDMLLGKVRLVTYLAEIRRHYDAP
jgi:hypothetical protein